MTTILRWGSACLFAAALAIGPQFLVRDIGVQPVHAESIVQILDSIDACAWYQVYVYNGSEQVGDGFIQVSPYYDEGTYSYLVPAYVLGMSESQQWTSVTTSYSGPGYC